MRETDYDYKARNKSDINHTPNLDIEDKIEQFLEAVLPDNASHTQIKETRKAFIAGMHQAYGDIMTISTFEECFAEKQLKKYYYWLNKVKNKYIGS